MFSRVSVSVASAASIALRVMSCSVVSVSIRSSGDGPPVGSPLVGSPVPPFPVEAADGSELATPIFLERRSKSSIHSRICVTSVCCLRGVPFGSPFLTGL